MADLKKTWSVTYTKHVKQKRKVYQDGILHFHSSKNKVILYDDCENVLDSRFVKKDDNIASGEVLAFDFYLVNIGDRQQDHDPVSKSNILPTASKINRTCESFQSPKFERKPLGPKRARLINLSPSQKVIREFKKSEMTKYGSSLGCPETTKSSSIEWQVLYTTQVTQKAKKYHDGFLQLLTCGSSCKQVVLYDETRRLLESRFLKKDEIIRSGESIAFDGHLVDIGECEADHIPPIDSNIRKTNCDMDGKKKAAYGPLHSHNQLPTVFTGVPGENEALARKQMTSNFKGFIGESNIFAKEVSKNPIRAAHEILSILRKAKSEKDVATMKSLSIEGFHASESTSFFQSDGSCQRKEQLQDTWNEGSTTIHLDEENSPMQKDEISKDEATNEIHLVEISKSAEKGSENSPSFFLGSETTNLVNHMVDTDHPEISRRYLDAPVLEPEDLATVKLELKTPITSVLQDTSTGDLKSRNRTQQVFCKENSTGGTAAAASGSDTSQVIAEPKHEKLPQPWVDSEEIDTRWQNGVHFIDLATSSNSTPREVADDQNISEQDISSKRTDEFPSFELGF